MKFRTSTKFGRSLVVDVKCEVLPCSCFSGPSGTIALQLDLVVRLRSLGMTPGHVPFQSIDDIFSILATRVRLFVGLGPEPLRCLGVRAVGFC